MPWRHWPSQMHPTLSIGVKCSGSGGKIKSGIQLFQFPPYHPQSATSCCKWRNDIFGHAARMPVSTSADKALKLHVNYSLNRVQRPTGSATLVMVNLLLLLVWHIPLGVRSAKRRHQSPECHSYCLIQGEIVIPQVLLDSLHPCSSRTSWRSPPVLRRGSSYDTPGICLVWHSCNMAEQRKTPCLDNSWQAWLPGCPSHLVMVNGWMKCVWTTIHQLTYGVPPLVVAIPKWCYDPQWLCLNGNDHQSTGYTLHAKQKIPSRCLTVSVMHIMHWPQDGYDAQDTAAEGQ